MCNIISHQGKTNQNYKIPLHNHSDGWNEKKRQTITSFREDVENTKLSYIAGGNVKCHSHFGKQFGSFSKINYRVSI